MAKTINVLGKEFEFFWSTQAVHDVAEECGGMDHLIEWINEEEIDSSIMLERCVFVFNTLINAAIIRDNFAIKHGFMQGEVKETFNLDEFKSIIGVNDLYGSITKMYNALSENLSTIEIPENAKVERKEIDKTLEEIKDQRAKKEECGE